MDNIIIHYSGFYYSGILFSLAVRSYRFDLFPVIVGIDFLTGFFLCDTYELFSQEKDCLCVGFSFVYLNANAFSEFP